jgi:hypothetical protein
MTRDCVQGGLCCGHVQRACLKGMCVKGLCRGPVCAGLVGYPSKLSVGF